MAKRIMRFLDLDFFLNDNAYRSGSDSGRLGSEYKPWSVPKVRRFLEKRCGLSSVVQVQGRTVENHDEVLDLWHMLIDSGRLRVPFEVVYIDAHPDLWVGGGLYLASGVLHVDSERVLAMLKKQHVHSGNYLTFAITYGWVASLVWVTLRKHLKNVPEWDGDARSILRQLKKKKVEASSIRNLSMVARDPGVPFKVLPWNSFRISETFDYIAMSKSPNFTPPESDKLIPIIEGYMRQI